MRIRCGLVFLVCSTDAIDAHSMRSADRPYMSLYNFCSLLTDEVAREVLTSDKLSEVLLSLNGHEDSSIREKSTEISLVWT